MSETINTRESRTSYRWQLLTTVSAIALFAAVCVTESQAADTDRSTIWVELGGQFEGVSGMGDLFTPPFILVQPMPGPYKHGSPLDAQRSAKYGFGPEGKITFQPSDSDWVISASVRYGRSEGNRHLNHETYIAHHATQFRYGPLHLFYGTFADFADTTAKRTQSHAIVDFNAGKDIGLGLFGSTSVLSAGVRFAQFSTAAQFNLRARPDTFITNLAAAFPPPFYFPDGHYHSYAGTGSAHRNFHGIGPSVSWNASLPFAGAQNTAIFTLDWGLNGALLFGRQRATVQHQTTSVYYTRQSTAPVYHHAPPAQNRIKSVLVPNAGGFAGISLKFPNAKLSIGYRGDFFFGAMDGGIDVAKKQTRGFYGPFATISVGLGG